MAASASFSPEFEPSEKDMPNVDKFVKLKQGDVLFQWQAAVAILEDEYKGTGRAVLDQSRYEFASHLLDIHRMWCRACPRFVPGSLPERSDRDTAGAGSAALSRQSQQKGETQTTDGISGLQSDAPVTQQEDSFEDYDRKDNMIETDMTCPSEDDELQGDGNTANTDKSLNVIDIIIKQEEVDDESIHDYEEEQRLDGWIEADTNQHLADVEMAMHSNPSSSTLGSEDTSRVRCDTDVEMAMHNNPSSSAYHSDELGSEDTSQVRCDTGMDSRDNLQNTSRFDGDQSYMSTGQQHPSLQKPYQCVKCMEQFNLKTELQIHMKSHAGRKMYQCSVCNKTYTNISHLGYHIRTHTGEKPYQCSLCTQRFTQKGYLTTHMKSHTGENLKEYQCHLCNKIFRSSSNLTIHIRGHTGERPYKCTLCDKTYRDSYNLSQHMRAHTGEKPYRCSICNKAFANSGNVYGHMRVHTGEKPYQCTVCDKAFTSSINLTYHIRSHTGEKPYQCSVCNKAFTRDSTLTYHMTLHEGEGPGPYQYQCPVCNNRYINRTKLSRHLKKHSGKEPH